MVFYSSPKAQKTWAHSTVSPLGPLVARRDNIEFFVIVIVNSVVLKDVGSHSEPPHGLDLAECWQMQRCLDSLNSFQESIFFQADA
jgi:hypothetical protein